MFDRLGRRGMLGVVLVGSLVVPTLGAGPAAAQAEPPARGSAPIAPGLATASGPTAVFVELDETAALDAAEAAAPAGEAAAREAAKEAARDTDDTADEVVDDAQAEDPGAIELYRTTNALPGVALMVDAENIAALAARSDVRAIRSVVPKQLTNSSAVTLTRTHDVWTSLGLTGEGMRIGIIDTGVDYTHANFGGPGTPEAYDAVDPTVTDESYFPTAKVVGGHDFAGELYDAGAGDPVNLLPDPDPNPLDCDGHGTHVAGSAAGFGVEGDGSTFVGDYDALDQAELEAMRIGPGTAPGALIYGLKVFGCPFGGAGSTNLVADAMDWSLDPNADGDFGDRLDVINVSIGADYTTPDDPDAAVAARLMEEGVMVVMSAGNGGDLFDIGSEAPEALSVASIRDRFVLRDALEATEPDSVQGPYPGQYSVLFDYTGLDLTAPVVQLAGVTATERDGCQPSDFAGVDVEDKVVWLEWDDNDATRACGSIGRSANAEAAGAAGALFSSELDDFSAGISGSPVIPVFQMTATATNTLRPALEAGTLVVRLAGELTTSLSTFNDDLTDTPSSFTSRGTRVPVAKPDIAGPGDTITSARVGSGDEAFVNSGTSMSAPHVAGIAVLVREAHPDWTPAQVKAALMNTAGHDVHSGDGQTGPIEGPNRVGAGRVDGLDAVNNEVLATWAAWSEVVSVGFGVVEAAGDLIRTEDISVTNHGATPVTYDVAYDPITDMPGTTYSVSPTSITVDAGSSASVTVTLAIDAEGLTKQPDPTLELNQTGAPRQYLADASGRVLLTPIGGGVELRVPVYAAPKPVAGITVPERAYVSPLLEGSLELRGTGLDQGTGTERYRSLVSALQLAAESPQLPPCGDAVVLDCTVNGTGAGGDIRYVGVASTVPSALAAGDPGSALIGFGIATWGDWANIGNNTIPFVDIDVDEDGSADFEVFVTKPVDTDLLLAQTVDLSTGAAVDLQPVNTFFGDVDTNVFDTNVIVLPVSVSALGIDPEAEAAAFDYFVGAAGYYAPGPLVDFLPDILRFDPLNPGLWVEGDLVQVAQPGTELVVHGTGDLLVLNLHNARGNRASVVHVTPRPSDPPDPPDAPVPPDSPPPPPALPACPEGAPPSGFSDVLPGNVHAPAIDCATARGLTVGTGAGLFSPAQVVTRGQLASFVARLLGITGDLPTSPSPDAFADDNGSEHEANIDHLTALGVLLGTDDGLVHEGETVTREQAASMIVRAYDRIQGSALPTTPDAFTDDDGSVHEPAINAAAAAGLVLGTGDGLFNPRAGLQRDQMASVLVRALGKAVTEGHAPAA